MRGEASLGQEDVLAAGTSSPSQSWECGADVLFGGGMAEGCEPFQSENPI